MNFCCFPPWRNSLGQWISKWGSQTSRRSITCELVKKKEMQILRPSPTLNTSETLGLRPSNLCFDKPTSWFQHTLEFENHCRRENKPNTIVSNIWNKWCEGCSYRKGSFKLEASVMSQVITGTLQYPKISLRLGEISSFSAVEEWYIQWHLPREYICTFQAFHPWCKTTPSP